VVGTVIVANVSVKCWGLIVELVSFIPFEVYYATVESPVRWVNVSRGGDATKSRMATVLGS
jgi:hypothetical protein